MNVDLLLELAWKSTLCACLSLAVLGVLRRCSAGEKALIAHVGVIALVLLPLAALLLPPLAFAVPERVSIAASALAPEPPASALVATGTTASSSSIDWGVAAVRVYAAMAAAFLLGIVVAVARLRLIRARAELIQDPDWLAALAAAQHRIGFKHGVALLSSSELNSPVSWGLMRPVIIVAPDALRRRRQAQAIIAHELAHVIRMDWLRLMLGRVAIALFWFNPLVWMLVRRSHQLNEEAADDIVLQGEISGCDYAELLIGAVRHAQPQPLLAANGVAPSRSSLGRRVAHVLDPSRPRLPAGLGWAVLALTGALSLNGVLASAEPLLAQKRLGRSPGAGDASASALEKLDGRNAQALATAIQRRDWSLRAPAGSTLFDQPAVVKPLSLALRDTDARVRRIAIWGLSELRPVPDDDDVISSVAALLDDEDGAVRGQAARALGDFQAATYAHRIASLLRDPLPSVRAEAAHALGDLQDPASRPALEAARADPDAGVRAKVGWALAQVAEAKRILRQDRAD